MVVTKNTKEKKEGKELTGSLEMKREKELKVKPKLDNKQAVGQGAANQ